MVDRDSAMNTLDLIAVKNLLSEVGIDSHLIEQSEAMPLTTLIVAIDQDSQNRERTINFSFIPLPDDIFPNVKLLQLYFELPFIFEQNVQSNLETLLLSINLTLPLGNFGIREKKSIYFRYSHALPKYEVISQRKESLIDITKLTIYALDSQTELIEQVATGQKTLDQVMAEIR